MDIRRASTLAVIVVMLAGACADGSAQNPSKGPAAASTPTNAAFSALSTNSSTGPGPAPHSSPSTPATTPKHEEPSAIFERIKPAITKCYETGRASTPTMIDGKLTLNASVEASGKINCVIPTDDSGLTQEVEDCMSSKLAATQVDATTTPWQMAIPIQVRGGSVQLATTTSSSSSSSSAIESVETHRMPDAFDALENLVPNLQMCLRDIDRSSGPKQVIIGARVNTDGRTACALATGGVPLKVSDCATQLFVNTKFPPPKGGMGLILVPITLTKR